MNTEQIISTEQIKSTEQTKNTEQSKNAVQPSTSQIEATPSTKTSVPKATGKVSDETIQATMARLFDSQTTKLEQILKDKQIQIVD